MQSRGRITRLTWVSHWPRCGRVTSTASPTTPGNALREARARGSPMSREVFQAEESRTGNSRWRHVRNTAMEQAGGQSRRGVPARLARRRGRLSGSPGPSSCAGLRSKWAGGPWRSEAQRTCSGLCFHFTDVAAGEDGLSWAKQGHREMAEVTEGGSLDQDGGGEVLRRGVTWESSPSQHRRGHRLRRMGEAGGEARGEAWAAAGTALLHYRRVRAHQAEKGPGFSCRSAGTDAGQRVEGGAEVRPG